MRIFVTGADGFIGQHLMPSLLSSHVVECLCHDLRDHTAVSQQLLEFNPEVIVHLAARTEVEKSFYEQLTFSEINYVGTVNLIEAAKKLPNLKNFVFASTMEVYGWQPESDRIKDGWQYNQVPVFDENTTPNPNAPYAVAKYACEKYLEYAGRAYSLPYTIIRQTNAYGRKDNNFFVTEQVIYQMLTKPDQISLGYATPYRNFIYVDDLIDAWLSVINNPDKAAGQLFCLGPPNAVQIKTYVQMIATKIGWTGTINWDTKPIRPGEVYLLNSSHQKISSVLGWEPKTNLDTGLDQTIQFWRNIIQSG
jgi:nucleoside-diphosphate-sugar epimerase